MGGVMHTIVDGWRLRVWAILQISGKLWVGVTPETGLNFQVAGRGGVLVMSERHTLGLSIAWP
jgi:hypothetical protein